MPRHPRHASAALGLSDRVYSALVDEARRRGLHYHPLNVGDTYLSPLAAARAEAQLSALHPRLHNYAAIQGEPALLAAIVARLEKVRGLTVDREAIQVMAGATAGFNVLAAALFEPGDEVIVLAPFWPLIRGTVRARGAVAVELPLFDRLGEAGFDPIAAIAQAITPRTVAIYVNTPHNPTGRLFPEARIGDLARLVREHDLWLLTDEAYEELYYTPERPPAIWAHPDLRDHALASHTLSKSYGLAGARVGFVHGPPAIMAVVRGVQTFFTYCAPRPLQLGGARALAEGDAWIAEARRLYAEAGGRAAAALDLPPPEGGTFLFFDLRPYLRDGEAAPDLMRRCLEGGVLLTPGSASGSAYESWARLCYTAVPPAELDDALRRLVAVLGRRRG